MSTDPSVSRDQREFSERVVRLLEHLKIPYGIGGSTAAMSFSNIARFINDVDVMFDTNSHRAHVIVPTSSPASQAQRTLWAVNLPGQIQRQ
jgi:hypothetical protein